MATPGVLPTSNVAGNNQTSPGLSTGSGIGPPGVRPVFQPTQMEAGTVPSGNPYLSAAPTSTPTLPSAPGSATYNPASSYSSGQTDISKQLTDILGKGVGGSLNYILQNMSGTDSAIFQQWLASQMPVQAQQEAGVRQNLGTMGVSGNSSVAGLAEANLGANFNATAAGENANLMQTGLQNTIGILQGVQPLAAKQVAQSGWTDFANVMANITGDIGALFGGKGPSPGSIQGDVTSDAPAPIVPGMENTSAQGVLPFGQDTSVGGPIDTSSWPGQTPDLSAFQSDPASVIFG